MMMNYSEFNKVLVCAGTRYSCPYYTITQQGLQPNKIGKFIDCIPTTFASILKSMRDGTFTRYCQKEADRYNRKHCNDIRDLKAYAISVYAFKDHRYSVEEKVYDENNKQIGVIRTNDAYNHWTGFKGFDFDPPKKQFTNQQREEIGITFKNIIYNELKQYKWFIGSGLSTGGHGTHLYTAIKLAEYYDNLSLEEKIRYHDMCYWYMFTKMIHGLELLVEELDYVTLSDAKEMLDTAMLKVGQTLNVTPVDNEPLINEGFVYEELEEVKYFFENSVLDYPTIDDSHYALLTDEQKIRYNIFLDVCVGNENKLIKHYKNTKNTNVIIHEYEDFDIHLLDNCKGPWHFEHKRKNGNKFWTGNQIIHTLSFFFKKDTIKNIWNHPKFYDLDPKDWIRFVDDPRWSNESYLPNFKLINWLNKNCNMKLSFKFEDDVNKNQIIKLTDDEFIYDKKDELYKLMKMGINIVESGTGTGKTTFVTKTFEDIFNIENNILNDEHKNIIITEPYNSVIKTKFGELEEKGIVDIIVKSKRIKIIENTSNNVCTNYYHINLMKDEDIEKVDLLIIDESHLLFSEAYRFGSISGFIHKVNKFKQVLMLTGTPIYESLFFNNINRIIVEKEDKRKITHEFLRFNPTTEIKYFNITVLSEFVHTLVHNGKKVFIYDKDISLQNCNRFKEINNDLKIAVYHKKHADEPSSTDDMKYIDKYHMLSDKFDVIISSCYFSVGNDLYDEGEAAVIMCGLHIPSEIIQVDGRWRKMTEINIYTIIKDEYEEIYDELDFDKIFKHKLKEIQRIKNDYTIRDSSLSIYKRYKNVDDEDLSLLGYMETLPVHQKTISYINNELGRYNIWCDERIMPLVYNFDYIEKNKQFSRKLKALRNDFREIFIDCLLKEQEFEWINNDNKLAKWQKSVYIMYKHIPKELFRDNIEWIKKIGCTDSIMLFNRLNEKISNNDIDFSEIYYMVKTSENLVSVEKNIKINDWLSYNDFECIKGYVLFATRYNKNDLEKEMIEGNYFKEFKDMCYLYDNIPNVMKLYLFKKNQGADTDYIDKWNDIINGKEFEMKLYTVPFNEYINNFERNKNKKTLKNIELLLLNELLLMFYNKKAYAGKIGGKISSPKKKCVITNKMKPVLLEKYNLKVGQIFESITDLVKYTNKSHKCITEWSDKGWIRKR